MPDYDPVPFILVAGIEVLDLARYNAIKESVHGIHYLSGGGRSNLYQVVIQEPKVRGEEVRAVVFAVGSWSTRIISWP